MPPDVGELFNSKFSFQSGINGVVEMVKNMVNINGSSREFKVYFFDIFIFYIFFGFFDFIFYVD